uniref:Uncharacterized protein n=1 Tax=Anopheles dirus TaxID=7168 RepID=A0A182NYR9_9DIPT
MLKIHELVKYIAMSRLVINVYIYPYEEVNTKHVDRARNNWIK